MTSTGDTLVSHQLVRVLESYAAGNYGQAVFDVEQVLGSGHGAKDLPARVLAAYAASLAFQDRGRADQALLLVREAQKQAPGEPEVLLAGARILVLQGAKQQALILLGKSLRKNPDDEGLLRLRASLGYRMAPVFGFLPRGHSINRLLGRIRYWLVTR